MGGLNLKSGDVRRQRRSNVQTLRRVQRVRSAHIKTSTQKPKRKLFQRAKRQESSKHSKEDGNEYRTDRSSNNSSPHSERDQPEDYASESEEKDTDELDDAESVETEPEPATITETPNCLFFNFDRLAERISDACECGKMAFDHTSMFKNPCRNLSQVEPTVFEDDGTEEGEDEIQVLASISINASSMDEESVKEEPKKMKKKKKRVTFVRTKGRQNDRKRGAAVNKLEKPVSFEEFCIPEEMIKGNRKSVRGDKNRELDDTQLRVKSDDRDKTEGEEAAAKVVDKKAKNRKNAVKEEEDEQEIDDKSNVGFFTMVGGGEQTIVSALTRSFDYDEKEEIDDEKFIITSDERENADGAETGAEQSQAIARQIVKEEPTKKKVEKTKRRVTFGRAKHRQIDRKRGAAVNKLEDIPEGSVEEDQESVRGAIMSDDRDKAEGKEAAAKVVDKKAKNRKNAVKEEEDEQEIDESNHVGYFTMVGGEQTVVSALTRSFDYDEKEEVDGAETGAEKGQAFVSTMEGLAVKEEPTKKAEKKKKRVTFGRAKRRQIDRKRGAAVNKLEHIPEESGKDDQKSVSGDEKRELDDTQLMITSDDRDKAEGHGATAKVVDEEANNRQNAVKEEKQDTNGNKTVGWNDFAIIGGAHNIISALTRTFDRHDRATLYHGNSNHEVNLSQKEPIVQQDSNSLVENSVKENATFQINPVVLEERNETIEKTTKQTTKKTTEKVEQENDKSKSNTIEGQELVFGGDDGDAVTVFSGVTLASGLVDDKDADTVVSGKTIASGLSKWARFFSPETEPIHEENDDDEKSIASKLSKSSKAKKLSSSASVTSSSSGSSSSSSSSGSSSSSSSCCSRSEASSIVAKSVYSSQIRAEDTDFFEHEPKVTASERSVKSYGNASKSPQAKLPSSASVASKPHVPTSAGSVKSYGNASKSSQAKLPSNASVASKPHVPTSAGSVKSCGNASKSSNAKLPASASVASKPHVPTSAGSVKSYGNASKSSQAKLPSNASVASKREAPTSAGSVKSNVNASKSSQAKLPSNASVASKPHVPASAGSVKSNGNASKSSNSFSSSASASVASKRDIHRAQSWVADVASKPRVPASAGSVKSNGNASKSSNSSSSSASASVASKREAPTSADSVMSYGTNATKSSKINIHRVQSLLAELPPSSSASVESKPYVPTSAGSVKSCDNSFNESLSAESATSSSRCSSDSSSSSSSVASPQPKVPTSARSVKSCGNASKSSKAKFPSSASVASKPRVPTSAGSVKSCDNSASTTESSSSEHTEEESIEVEESVSEEESIEVEESVSEESEISETSFMNAPNATSTSWWKGWR